MNRKKTIIVRVVAIVCAVLMVGSVFAGFAFTR